MDQVVGQALATYRRIVERDATSAATTREVGAAATA
jgi:hypothetical protein